MMHAMHKSNQALDGLMKSMPKKEMGMMSDKGMMKESSENSEDPVNLLQKAVALHRKHMTDKASVSPESQQQLMDYIEDALEALTGMMG